MFLTRCTFPLYLTPDPYCMYMYSTDLVDTKNYNMYMYMYLWETAAGDDPTLCEDCDPQSDTVHVLQVSMIMLDVKR